jgi:hypothetical protein
LRHLKRILFVVVCGSALAFHASGQGPRPADDSGKDKAKDKDYSNAPIVVKMMAFNKKKDGKLTKDEVTDERLHRLFDQADTNKDGVVTKEELMALAAKLDTEGRDGDRGGPGGRGGDGPGRRGPGGPGGRGGDGPGGRGGPGGPGGPPQPGLILAPPLQDALKLTDEQKKQLDELQKEVDGKLAKILTDEQKKQLKEMKDNPGRGGPGGRGDRGPGGPDRRRDDR